MTNRVDLRVLVLTGAFLAGFQAQANLITNGSFESVTPVLSTNEICTTFTGTPYPSCTAADWTGGYQIGKDATIGVGGSSFNIPQPDPDGTQALILQSSTSFVSTATQSISIGTTDMYMLTFYAANRSTAGLNGAQTLEVLLDGTVVPGGTYTSLPGSWTPETLSFNIDAGSHTLSFEGARNNAPDVTAFVDNAVLVEQSSSTPEPSPAALIALAGFALLIFRVVKRKSAGV